MAKGPAVGLYVRGSQVGHTFALGARYSEPLQALCARAAAPAAPAHMACYGVGLTRLLAASVEALSSDTALRWPEAIAPYSVVVIGPKEGSKEWLGHGVDRVEDVARRLERHRREDVLLDDRHGLTIGKRLMQADRVGYPNIVVCGRSALEHPPRYELYRSAGGAAPQLLDLNQLEGALADQRGADAEDIEECAVK